MKIIEIDQEKIVSIDSLHIRKRYCEHSVCVVKLQIKQEFIMSVYQTLNQDLTITDDYEKCIFKGKITDVDLKSGHSGILTIKAVSFSVKTDLEPKFRVFRNEKRSLNEILNKIKDRSPDNFNININGNHNIDHPVVQYNETNFQFINRLARECGLDVFVNDTLTDDTPSIYISEKKRDGQYVIDLDKSYELHNIWNFFKHSNKTINGLRIVTDIYADLGDSVSVKSAVMNAGNSKYIVYEWDMYKKHEIFIYEYKLYEPSNFPKLELIPLPEDVHIHAVVKDNNDSGGMGRIQVRFADQVFEDMDPESKLWIPYRSPYTAVKDGNTSFGIVFIPDKDEPVDVVYSKGEFYACECLRRKAKNGSSPLTDEVKIDTDLESPDQNKYIANIYGRKITFNKDMLELKSGKNTITLKDDEIEIKVGENKISIKEDDILINADKNLKISTGDDTSVKAGKKIDFKASDNASISGKDTTIKGSNNVYIH